MNPKFNYLVRNSPTLVPTHSQINVIHTFRHSFLKIHFNIILSSTPRLLTLLFSSDLAAKIPHTFSITPLCATCSVHLVVLDQNTPRTLDYSVQITKTIIMQFSPFPCYMPFLRSKYIPFLKLLHMYICYILKTQLYTHWKQRMSFTTVSIVKLSMLWLTSCLEVDRTFGKEITWPGCAWKTTRGVGIIIKTRISVCKIYWNILRRQHETVVE
jgi:hypothetical protein